ncbi:MAG TPA: hypothetical protein VNV63_03670, partial [Nitrospiria bacterium]|nr:hypothetical protein [Nitrospiria bacterium]
VDGFLLVVAAHKTPQKLLEEALNVMDPAKAIGLVFNGDDRPVFGHSQYYYSYIHQSRAAKKSSSSGQLSSQP